MVCTFTLNTNPPNPSLREYFSCDHFWFPQMVYVGADTGKNSGGKKSGGGKMTLQCRQENGEKQEEMALHPSCIAGKAKSLSSKYLVYHERVKTTRVFIRDATPVSPYALILFGGGRMQVENCPSGSLQSVLRLDGWLGFRCPRRDHLVIMKLREELERILRHKVENPKDDFTEESAGIIEAVKAILSMDDDGKVLISASAPERSFDLSVMRGNSGRGGGRGKQMGSKGRGKGKGGGRGNGKSGRR